MADQPEFKADREALAHFLDALDEWGCVDNTERAEAIASFIDGGYDLSAYEERSAYQDGPVLRLIDGGKSNG